MRLLTGSVAPLHASRMPEQTAKTGVTELLEEADRTIAEAVETVEAAKREKQRAKRLRRDLARLQEQVSGNKPAGR